MINSENKMINDLNELVWDAEQNDYVLKDQVTEGTTWNPNTEQYEKFEIPKTDFGLVEKLPWEGYDLSSIPKITQASHSEENQQNLSQVEPGIRIDSPVATAQ